MLAIVSLMVHGVLYLRSRSHSGPSEQQTAVGVTITNVPEPAAHRVYVRETAPAVTTAAYGVADVSEEHALMPMQRAPAQDVYGNPLPTYRK